MRKRTSRKWPIPDGQWAIVQGELQKVVARATTPKPDHPCGACDSNDWWQRKDGGWVCNRCHPQP